MHSSHDNTFMDDLLTLLDYHAWAVERTIGALAPLSTEEFGRDLGSSHGGVGGTLAHLYGTDLIWTARLRGERPPDFPAPGELLALPDLLPHWLAKLQERRIFADTLRPDQLVRYTNLKGEPMVSRVDEIVRHIVNHAAYHRGQLVTLLRQLGHSAVNTDLIAFYRQRAAGDQR